MKIKIFLVMVVTVITMHESVSEASDNFLNLGILHTVPRYAQWHAKEEMLTKLLTQYQEMAVRTKKFCLRGSFHRSRKNPNETREKRYISIKEANDLLLFNRRLRIWNCVRQQPRNKVLEKISKHLKLASIIKNVNNGRNGESKKKKEKWVGSHDMFFTSMAWIHVQEVYMIRPQDLSHGLEFETTAGGVLTCRQKTEIGEFALLQKRYYMAIEWLKEGLLCSQTKNSLVKQILYVAVQEHNKIGGEISKQVREESYEAIINLYNDPVSVDSETRDGVTVRQVSFERHKGPGPNALPSEQFMDLCQGNAYQSPKTRARLKCFYNTKSNKFFTISPLKVEKLSEIPPLYQFYDVLSNATMAKLIGQVEHYVKTGVAIGSSDNDIRARCGTSAGIGLDPEKTDGKIYKISEMVSGLKLLICPKHDQFVEYTYGRWYRVHQDHSYNKPETMHDLEVHGDRIATMLYYLEVPTLGGYTPFLNAGVYPYPVKGSAIFWFNMYRNGTLRNDVNHGACPVIHGNKISIKITSKNSNFNSLNFNDDGCI